MKCDRCYKNIPDTQIYDVQIGMPLTPVILCKKCIDEYKELLSEFRGYSHLKVGELDYYPTREKIGDPKGYTVIPHNNPWPTLERFIEKPKHEGRRPTNIFSKLFY